MKHCRILRKSKFVWYFSILLMISNFRCPGTREGSCRATWRRVATWAACARSWARGRGRGSSRPRASSPRRGRTFSDVFWTWTTKSEWRHPSRSKTTSWKMSPSPSRLQEVLQLQWIFCDTQLDLIKLSKFVDNVQTQTLWYYLVKYEFKLVVRWKYHMSFRLNKYGNHSRLQIFIDEEA